MTMTMASDAGTPDIPTAPGALPALGHIPSMLRDPFRFLSGLPEYGDLVRLRLGPADALAVCDPGLFHEAMHKARTFDRGGMFYQRFAEATGNHVGTCPYPDHRRLRRLTQPAFAPARMPDYTEIMATHIDGLVRTWQDGQTVDVTTAMMTLTSSISVAAIFGTRLAPQAVDDAVASIKLLIRALYRRMLLPPGLDRIPFPAKYQAKHAVRQLRAIASSVIIDRRGSDSDDFSLLSMLLAGQDDPADAQHAPMTDREISEQVVAFFIAAAETTANSLAWSLNLLGAHPELAREVAAESRAIVGDGRVRHDHLAHLTLTRKVIAEALRMYPPAWLVTRQATEEAKLGEYSVRRGATIVLSPYILHHRADIFPRPDVFDPYRPEVVSPHPRGAFVPFGAGVHKCIGDVFAQTLTPLALAAITSRWSLTHPDGKPARAALGMMLAPRNLRMTVNSRTLG